ncbi:MAG: PKD domain-containing protein [Candidatus Bipolaricaulota bacterium]|nr:PKD domain-containing protein [Candidatus Bipolaricaulota bacterium]
MRNIRRVWIVATAIAVAVPWMAAAAWKADFTPSTYNPGVGEAVSFAVCEPCLTGGTYTYRWDWNGDDVADVETRDPMATYSYAAAGYYEVQLTIADDTGRRETCRKGVVVGAVPAFAVRDVVAQDDGTLLVVVTVRAVEPIPGGFGFEEQIPQGWQAAIEDPGGTFLSGIDAPTRTVFAQWTAVEAGTELVFTYRLSLYAGYAVSQSRLAGELAGYIAGVRFRATICGVLGLP